MADVIPILEQSARLVRTWGQAHLTTGQTLSQALTVQGVSLWELVAVDLAVYRVPEAMSRRAGEEPPLVQKIKPYLSWAKHTLLARRPHRYSPDGCYAWPATPTVLFLGFSHYMFRDVLRPVAERFAAEDGPRPVALYDSQVRSTAVRSRSENHLQSVWEHWHGELARETRALRKWLRWVEGDLRAAAALPKVVQAEGGLAWSQMKPVFAWLFRIRLPRLLPQVSIARHILRRHRPVLVVSPDVADPRTRLYVLVARQYGIPSLEIVFGDIFGKECVEWQFCLADHLAVSGEATRLTVASFGVPADRITVTGSPRHDKLVRGAESEAIRLRRRLGVSTGKAMVLFASTVGLAAYDSLRNPSQLENVKKVVFQTAHSIDNLVLVVKPHPLENVRATQRLAEDCHNLIFVDQHDDIRELTKACDAFVTLGSTSTLGAILLNKLVVWPALPGVVYWEDLFIGSGAVLVARTAEELQRYLQVVANGSSDTVLRELEVARRRFLEHWVYKADGQAAARIEGLARRIIGLSYREEPESTATMK